MKLLFQRSIRGGDRCFFLSDRFGTVKLKFFFLPSFLKKHNLIIFNLLVLVLVFAQQIDSSADGA